MGGSLAGVEVPVLLGVFNGGAPEDLSHGFASDLGDPRALLPQLVVDADCALRRAALGRGHGGTVSGACALTQHCPCGLTGSSGCAHGVKGSTLTCDCLVTTLVVASQHERNTHRRQILAEATATGDETTKRGASPMSMAATAPLVSDRYPAVVA